ncbi:DUF3298 and DUF4163 domain-containing protein [Sphingobacterium sp. SRCM116780]|uniref:DUF3298 and DUF4163 domain-containing protein n=1 Tax=Sphingobacterium sp. SRCM116780 TaxID=2907623 RepID=UPI001F3B2B28|nr:DUF3298 and DUF4163 domain-containing protein [Sphingobacterium sp. SRCM116780]UIR57662.1 DUF3298 and DUF4163 domain-containing protein [Sphingobacterium sp. SRCM116780]
MQKVVNADTLHYEMKELHEYSRFFVKEGQKIDTTYFKAQYPQFKDTVINNLLQTSINLEGDSQMVTSAKRFVNAYDEYVEENNGNSTATWFRDLQAKVYQNTSKFISIETSQTEYTGGAHGDHFTLFSHFDTHTDQKITLNDIVNKENQKELIKIAERYFRKLEKLSDTESLNDKFFFEAGNFTLADNFALNKDGLLFYYNVYEIKSYAEGNTALKVPYKDIKHLISAKGLEYINSIN